MIFLDNSVLIEGLTEGGRLKSVFRRRLAGEEPMAVPALVLYEWLRGPRTVAELHAQQELFPNEQAVPFDWEVAALSARLYRGLARARLRTMDIAIAACALRHEAALWTLNVEDFADIPGLKLLRART